ncbi:MAG: hypothetical protein R3A10_19405 [Caldilineaceae bacterium]
MDAWISKPVKKDRLLNVLLDRTPQSAGSGGTRAGGDGAGRAWAHAGT